MERRATIGVSADQERVREIGRVLRTTQVEDLAPETACATPQVVDRTAAAEVEKATTAH